MKIIIHDLSGRTETLCDVLKIAARKHSKDVGVIKKGDPFYQIAMCDGRYISRTKRSIVKVECFL